MPITVKFNSRQTERNESEIVTTVCWTGSQEEILEFSQAERPGTSTADGTLKSSRVYPESPKIWVCEKKYVTDLDGEPRDKPNAEYGQKSAQLHGSMLSVPVEILPNYRKHWNYYLAAKPGITAVPAWWETATAQTTELVGTAAQNYKWVKSPAEAPVDKDGNWQILKNASKPGEDSVDVATYSITETAKFRSARAAGRMIGNTLNTIGRPDEDFGMTPSGYNWKCDNAEVSYNGKAWFATMTWTRSANNQGWDPDKYGRR